MTKKIILKTNINIKEKEKNNRINQSQIYNDYELV